MAHSQLFMMLVDRLGSIRANLIAPQLSDEDSAHLYDDLNHDTEAVRSFSRWTDSEIVEYARTGNIPDRFVQPKTAP